MKNNPDNQNTVHFLENTDLFGESPYPQQIESVRKLFKPGERISLFEVDRRICEELGLDLKKDRITIYKLTTDALPGLELVEDNEIPIFQIPDFEKTETNS